MNYLRYDYTGWTERKIKLLKLYFYNVYPLELRIQIKKFYYLKTRCLNKRYKI